MDDRLRGDGCPNADRQVIVLRVGREEVQFLLWGYATAGELKGRHFAYPNPSADRSTISFAVDRTSLVRLRIFDVAGRLARTVLSAELGVSRHEAHWDGQDDQGATVASGVYYYDLEIDGRSLRGKLLRVR